MSEPSSSTSSTTRRPRSPSCSPTEARRGGNDRPHRRLDSVGRAYELAAALRAGLERGVRLVGRRALRAARRRALELSASRRRTLLDRLERAARGAPDPRRARRRPRPPTSTSGRSTGVDARPAAARPRPGRARRPRSSRARRSCAERTRLVTSGPAGLEPFVDRVTLTLPALLAAPPHRLPRRPARARRTPSSRAFFGRDRRATRPRACCAPATHRSTSTSIPRRPGGRRLDREQRRTASSRAEAAAAARAPAARAPCPRPATSSR